MKKIFFVFTLMCSLLLSSCDTMAQIMVDEYYDYSTQTVVIYRDNIAYYRIWDGMLNGWRYDIVPYHRMSYIRHRRVPQPRGHWDYRPQPRGHWDYRPQHQQNHQPPRNNGSIGGSITPRGGNTQHNPHTNGGHPSNRGSISGGLHSQGGRH